MKSTTVKTVLEYAVMPVQNYEFTCDSCFMVKPIWEHEFDGRCVHCS